jgi:hypothetical protein
MYGMNRKKKIFLVTELEKLGLDFMGMQTNGKEEH